MRAPVPEALALALLGGFACGAGGGASDAGAEDARARPDAAIISCAEDSDCAEQRFARLCRADRCTECAIDAECAEAPSLGPSCDAARGYCVCASDDDCAGNPLGARCEPVTRSCGCVSEQDCGPEQDCRLEPYLGAGIRTCQGSS